MGWGVRWHVFAKMRFALLQGLQNGRQPDGICLEHGMDSALRAVPIRRVGSWERIPPLSGFRMAMHSQPEEDTSKMPTRWHVRDLRFWKMALARDCVRFFELFFPPGPKARSNDRISQAVLRRQSPAQGFSK